jgi:hypothetical protein
MTSVCVGLMVGVTVGVSNSQAERKSAAFDPNHAPKAMSNITPAIALTLFQFTGRRGLAGVGSGCPRSVILRSEATKNPVSGKVNLPCEERDPSLRMTNPNATFASIPFNLSCA